MTDVYSLPRVLMDAELRSYKDIRQVGAWRYSEDETTEIMCIAFRMPCGKEILWTPHMPFPQEVIDAVHAGWVFECHNAQMERSAWKYKLVPLGIPMPTKWVDTMAACAYRALPLSLDKVGEALNLDVQKNERGKYLIRTLCKYKGPTKKEPDRVYREDWDLTEELYDYCMDDVRSEHCLSESLGPMPEDEYRLWVFDQLINQRGVYLDMEAVAAAKHVVDEVTAKMTVQLQKITGGKVKTHSSIDQIMKFMSLNGVAIPNLQKNTIEDYLAPGMKEKLPDVCVEVLEIRQQLAKASTKKLIKMEDCVSRDGRVRGLMQYHGASTGRWAGRLVQPQNFPRGDEDLLDSLKSDKDTDTMEELIKLIKTRDVDFIEIVAGDPMNAVSTALRGMFQAEPGKVYRIADFAAIEAVVTAWVSGERWKVEAFREINAKRGYEGSPDIYCATASKIFGYPVTDKEKQKRERQVGKVCELAFGYQGGVRAWKNFDRSGTYTDEEIDDFKLEWRDRHPMIKKAWYGLDDAAIGAVKNPAKAAEYRDIVYQVEKDEAGTWLTCILPNGRRLWYYNPVIENYVTPWGRESQRVVFWGKDSKRGGAWGPIRGSGGLWLENIVQAISRDLMAEAMVRVERAGYPVILTVHDEIVSECDPEHGSQEEFQELMAWCPPWAAGCPIAVSGDEVMRYQKV